MAIFDKLDEIEKRYDELAQQLQDPVIATDGRRLTTIAKEHGSLERKVQAYRNFKAAQNELTETRALAEDPDEDQEMREVAASEVASLGERSEQLLDHLKAMLVSSDEDSHRDAIVEIRAGTGGNEASLFAADLFRMYSRFAERQRWKIEIMDSHPTEVGGFKEIVFSMSGSNVFRLMRYESGGHRVQRVPSTESQGRIHTSAATIAVLPQADEVEVELHSEDLKIDTYSAGGPGGQHVNKTQSAVRITHEPTGIVVQCQDERSQHKNKDRAMRHLRSRLYDHIRAQQEQARGSMRRSLIGSGDRNDRIRTYNFPQSRVTDHRIGLSLHNLQAMLDGDLQELFDKLGEYDREQQIEDL